MDNGGAAKTATAPVAGKTKRMHGIVYISPNRCKGCGFCIAFCPPGVLEFAAEFNAQGYHAPRLADPVGCTGCDLCGLYCPDFAIYAVMIKEQQLGNSTTSSPGVSRAS
ncbi:MAG: 4Fe-4S dicluster domain-containing protein [Acidobacteria bacterium]|nr:4Fe-4S dicluster domain-containing protein [Acidobacteriota bacterium]